MLCYWMVKGIVSLSVFDNFNISDSVVSGVKLIFGYINAFSPFFNVSLFWSLSFVFLQTLLYAVIAKIIIDCVLHK